MPRAYVTFVVLCACNGVWKLGGKAHQNAVVAPAAPLRSAEEIARDPLTCDGNAERVLEPMRRISSAQYKNTLRVIIDSAVPTLAASVKNDVEAAFSLSPDDARYNGEEKRGGYRRMAQTVTDDHVYALLSIASAVAERLTHDTATIRALLGPCADDSASADACIDAFIRRFGALAERRPLGEDDVAFYKETYAAQGIDAHGLSDVIVTVLNSPYLFYMIEHGVGGSTDAVTALDPWESAARLSYALTDAPPDADLQRDAASGALATDAGFAAAVDRLFSRNDVRTGLLAFARDWLWLNVDQVQDVSLSLGRPVFERLRDQLFVSSATKGAAIAESLDFAMFHLMSDDAPFSELLRSKKSFARTDDVAAIYGVPTWDGSSEPPLLSGRSGILGRAASMFNGSGDSRPILRGVQIRKGVLCDYIAPPPGNAANTPLPTMPTASTRDLVEALTEVHGTACASCHSTFINPLGFAFESLDGFGRVRTRQTLVDATTYTVLGYTPVNTTTHPQVSGGDDAVSSGVTDLAEEILASGKAEECFARGLFRHTAARFEVPAQDGCTIASLRDALRGGQPIKAALRASFLQRQWREKRFN